MAGRPEFKPTPAQREEVEILSAARVSETDIAKRLKIDDKTLRKYFREELDHGFAKRNTDLLIKMYYEARDGNASHMKMWWSELRANAPQQEIGQQPLGKKEQERIDAAKVGGADSPWGGALRPPPLPRKELN